jgi:hypothetical protein
VFVEEFFAVYGFIAMSLCVFSFITCFDLIGTISKSGRVYGYIDHTMICIGVGITWPLVLMKACASKKWWTE